MENPATAKRKKIAFEMIELGQEVSNLAEEAHKMAREKLMAIQKPEKEDAADKRSVEPIQEWPPLFAEMRTILFQIKNSINLIQNDLDRTEI